MLLPVGHCDEERPVGHELEIEKVRFCKDARPDTSVIDDIIMDIDHVITPAVFVMVPVNDAPLIVAPGTTVSEPEPVPVAVKDQLLALLY